MDIKTKNKRVLTLSLILGAGGAALYALAGIAALNEAGFFVPKTAFTVSAILAAVAVLLPPIYALFSRDRTTVVWDFTLPLSLVPMAAVGFAGVLECIELFASLYSAGSLKIDVYTVVTVITLLLCLLLVCACAASCLFPEGGQKAATLFRLAMPLYFAFYAGYVYLGKNFSLSSPVKIVSEFSAGICAVFFLSELRLSLGQLQRRFYLAAAAATGAFCLYFAGGALTAYFFRGVLMAFSLEELVLTLCVGVYAVCRFFAVLRARETGTSPLVRSIIDEENRAE